MPTKITDADIDNLKGTKFQHDVWKALLKIPYGETRTYAQVAKMSGHPNAIRAVANAIGKNPMPPIIPCQTCQCAAITTLERIKNNFCFRFLFNILFFFCDNFFSRSNKIRYIVWVYVQSFQNASTRISTSPCFTISIGTC